MQCSQSETRREKTDSKIGTKKYTVKNRKQKPQKGETKKFLIER